MNEDGAPTNLVDLIGRLVEPPEPAPVSLVPQTAGWWVLGALLLSALGYGLWRFMLHWRADAYRRAALSELALAPDDPAAIASILRRAALAAYPGTRSRGSPGRTGSPFCAKRAASPRPPAQPSSERLTRRAATPGSCARRGSCGSARTGGAMIQLGLPWALALCRCRSSSGASRPRTASGWKGCASRSSARSREPPAPTPGRARSSSRARGFRWPPRSSSGR